MLPRRGICYACRIKGHGAQTASRLPQVPRQFSSVARGSKIRQSHQRLTIFAHSERPRPSTTTSVASSIPLIATSLHQTRLQSTIQNASLDPNATFPPPDFVSDTTAQLPAEPEWYIGLMRDAGLDFGWGPSSMMQWAFEHLQVWGGYEMGVTILILAVLQRLITFPLVLQAADVSQRFRAISPEMRVLQEGMRAAAQEQNQLKMMKARKAMGDLRKKHNIKYWKMFLPMIQMPLGFGAWRMLRNAAWLPAPGMTTGGFLWFQNLAVADPYYILPLVIGGFQHLTVRLGGEMSGTLTNQGTMRNLMLYGLPGLSVFVTAVAPAAIQLTFGSAAILSFCTNLVLRNESFRAMCGIAPRITRIPTAEELERTRKEEAAKSVYKGTITVANNVKTRQSQRQYSSSNVAPRPAAGLSKLNPRNWFRSLNKLSEDVSGISGSPISSPAQRKIQQQAKAAKDKADALEAQRRAERNSLKAKHQSKSRGSGPK